jgi:hypothetical protein
LRASLEPRRAENYLAHNQHLSLGRPSSAPSRVHLLMDLRAMRIAQIFPLYEAVPPALYGGTERIVAYLSDALVQFGHQGQTTTLFIQLREADRA